MITIVLLISRPEYLDLVFANLEFMDCDASNVNLLTIIDGDISLFVDARNRTNQTKFANSLTVQFKSRDKMKNYDTVHRRHRIAAIHNSAKQFIKRSEYIFTIEDDTTFKPDTLTKLLKDYMSIPFAGFIQGVEVGRHGINHFGVWGVDDAYDPGTIFSHPAKTHIQECDAGGLYCMLTKAEIYMAHDFKPFQSGDLGPDVNYGIELRKQGYKNYTDWSIPCNHHTKHGVITPQNTDTQLVEFLKIEHRWRQKSL